MNTPAREDFERIRTFFSPLMGSSRSYTVRVLEEIRDILKERAGERPGWETIEEMIRDGKS